MADRGFEIGHLLPDGVTLVIPSFMNGQAQLTTSKVRVHVERITQRVKLFRILAEVFQLRMKPSLDMIWKVCGYLVNFISHYNLQNYRPRTMERDQRILWMLKNLLHLSLHHLNF